MTSSRLSSLLIFTFFVKLCNPILIPLHPSASCCLILRSKTAFTHRRPILNSNSLLSIFCCISACLRCRHFVLHINIIPLRIDFRNNVLDTLWLCFSLTSAFYISSMALLYSLIAFLLSYCFALSYSYWVWFIFKNFY